MLMRSGGYRYTTLEHFILDILEMTLPNLGRELRLVSGEESGTAAGVETSV